MNTDTWKRYKFSDLFTLSTGKDYGAAEANANPGTNNFIGSSILNNGITAKTSLPNKQVGGCLTVAKDGSVGSAFYQSEPFSTNGHVVILRPTTDFLTPPVVLFLCTVIKLEGSVYNFGRAWGLARMTNSTLKLPTTPTGTIDWNWIEAYVNNQISRLKDK